VSGERLAVQSAPKREAYRATYGRMILCDDDRTYEWQVADGRRGAEARRACKEVFRELARLSVGLAAGRPRSEHEEER
jgi:hypothetical protein